jgi:hypothetical protein
MTALVLLVLVVLVTVQTAGIAQEDNKRDKVQQEEIQAEEQAKKQEKEKARSKEAAKPDQKEIEKIEKLIAALGDKEFAVREKAHSELAEIGEPARPWLKKALEGKDPEVRWRAERLLCLLDEEQVRGRKPGRRLSLRLPHEGEGEDFDSRSLFDDRLSSHLNDLFQDLFPEDFEPFFFRFDEDEHFDVDKLLDEFRRDTGRLNIQLGSTTQYNFQRSENGETVNLSLSIAPDGAVEATVTRTNRALDDNEEKTETTTYTAASLEEFKKNYPEVVEEFELDGFRVSVDVPRFPRSNRLGLGLRLDKAPFGFSRKIQRKVLGVYTGDMSPALRSHLDLEPGTGVLISEVAKGSFAARIGVQPMDVVVSIKGSKVGGTDDIRKIMASIEEDETVAVEVIRKGKRLELEGKYGG